MFRIINQNISFRVKKKSAYVNVIYFEHRMTLLNMLPYPLYPETSCLIIFQCVMVCVSVHVERAVVSVDGARHGKGSAGVCG